MIKDLSLAWSGSGKAEAALCRKLFPDAVSWYISHAEKLCQNTFIFRDHWEIKKKPEAVTFQAGIDWGYMPATDREWTYALNRHSYLPTMAKAYLLTGNDGFVAHYSRLVLDWLQNMPLSEDHKLTGWRSIETGARCENWLKSMEWIRDCRALPETLFRQMEESLRIHAGYLTDAHTDFHRLSNWGVFQDKGLFLLGVHFREQSYIDLSLKRLGDNLRLQVLPDGIHWEQSPQYHVEVLQCFLTVLQVAGRCGVTIPEGFAEAVCHMADGLAVWLKPDGRLLRQSDSDDVDACDVMVRAAVLFRDLKYKACAGGELAEANLWDLGEPACREYREGRAPSVRPSSVAFAHSGNYFLKDSDHYLHMHCGCLGSGHGHADLLHFDLFAYGEDILLDSGRYTYQDIPIRQVFKSPAGHNTMTVDGKDFTVYNGAWDYAPIAQPVRGECRFTETADYISGGHLGYQSAGVFVFRKIVWVRPGLYVIFDEFYTHEYDAHEFHSHGVHSYTQYFHWNNRGDVTMEGPAACYRGKSAQAKLIPLTDGVKSTLTDVPLSRVYNDLEQGKCLRIDHQAEGFTCLVTVLATAPVGDIQDMDAGFIPVTLTRTGEKLTDDKAQAVRIVWNEKQYTVICLHREVISEVGLIEAGGCKGYGKMLVFSPDVPDGVCLAW